MAAHQPALSGMCLIMHLMRLLQAPSGRSKCKATGEKIPKDAWRVGMVIHFRALLHCCSALKQQWLAQCITCPSSQLPCPCSRDKDYFQDKHGLHISSTCFHLAEDHETTAWQMVLPMLKGTKVEYCMRANSGTCKHTGHKFEKVGCATTAQLQEVRIV